MSILPFCSWNYTTLTRSFAGLLFIILIALSVGAQEEQPQGLNTDKIKGRVVDDRGQKLAGAIVNLRTYGSIQPSRQTTTDEAGTFQFSGLQPVVYFLSATFPAHTPAPRDPDSTLATSYRAGDDVTFVMIKGGVITGRVSSASNDPVVGMRVRAHMLRDVFGQRTRYGAPIYEQYTDDRGVYRIYGLPGGTYVVSAGGGYSNSAFANDVPTYAPSSTVDTAAQITVHAGQETTNIDIRYRDEQGHYVSGKVAGPDQQSFSVTLTTTLSEGAQLNENILQGRVSTGPEFSFSGIADGDYDVTAQSYSPTGERSIVTKRIRVSGSDVTGIDLSAKPLASISGRVVLEDSKAPECKGKRRAVVTETLISAWHNQRESKKEQPQFIWSLGAPVVPNQQGDIRLRSLSAGQYQIVTRLFEKYWYLRSISLPASGASGQQASQRTDAVANWITIRSGEQLTGLVVTLSEGAASLTGNVQPSEGETMPGRLYVYLVPVEREKELDVLRFFAAPVLADRTVSISHIAPGRYWIVTQPALDGPLPTLTRLRLPDEKGTRAKLRSDGEQTKIEIEFKPCQNVTGYELQLQRVVEK